MRVCFLIIFSFLFLSCSNNSIELITEDFSMDTFPQKWKLFKATGMVAGSETMGDDMPWQEYYIFMGDRTFLKTRIQEGETITAEGTYETGESEGRKTYLWRYNSENIIIGNCTGNLEEYLYQSEDGKTLFSSWWNCDGPGLFYKQEDL